MWPLKFTSCIAQPLNFILLPSPFLTNGRFPWSDAVLKTRRVGKWSWIAVILSVIEEGFQGQHNQRRRTGGKWLQRVRVHRGYGRGGSEKRNIKEEEEKWSVNKALSCERRGGMAWRRGEGRDDCSNVGEDDIRKTVCALMLTQQPVCPG